MQHTIRLALPGLFIGLTGCISQNTLIKLKQDGSGTVEVTTTMSAEAMAQMKQSMHEFSKGMGGSSGKEAGEVFKVSDAQAQAGKMGTGVTFVKAEQVKSGEAEGLKATYAFQDITQLKLGQMPKGPGPMGGSMKSSKSEEQISFRFERLTNGHSKLTAVFPKPTQPVQKAQQKAQPSAQPADEMSSQELEMARKMFKGLKVNLAVEVDGQVLKTNSPFQESSQVTLLELDFGSLLDNPAKLQEVMQNKSGGVEGAKAQLAGLKGVKLNPDSEVTIEFGGAKESLLPWGLAVGGGAVFLGGLALVIARVRKERQPIRFPQPRPARKISA